jgi:hypothetical protein
MNSSQKRANLIRFLSLGEARKIERKTLKNGQNPLNLLTNLNIEE